jgi:hypothetical protein
MNEQEPLKREKTEAEVSDQISRIGNRLLDRAQKNRIIDSVGSLSVPRDNPELPDSQINTSLRRATPGLVTIGKEVRNSKGAVGTEVSVAPARSIDAYDTGRAYPSGKVPKKYLYGEEKAGAVAAVPGQLAEIRGNLAEQEIQQEQSQGEAGETSDLPKAA